MSRFLRLLRGLFRLARPISSGGHDRAARRECGWRAGTGIQEVSIRSDTCRLQIKEVVPPILVFGKHVTSQQPGLRRQPAERRLSHWPAAFLERR